MASQSQMIDAGLKEPESAVTTGIFSRVAGRWIWVLPLLAGFMLRIAVWWLLPYRLPNIVPISDEGEYQAAAIWLAEGRNFSFFKDWIWTRPPVYVAFLAAHIKLFGPANLVPIRLSQAILGTATVGLVMVWAALLAPVRQNRRAALLAGWATALAYSLASFSFFLLSETLFISLLLAAFVCLTRWAQHNEPRVGTRWLVAGAVLLALGSLTRALLAGALPLVAAWVWWTAYRRGLPTRRRLSHLLMPALLTIVVSAVILPWSVYNTRFYDAKRLILIDTTGGYNAMLGAQAARLQFEAEQRCQEEPTPVPCAPPATRDEEAVYESLIAFPDHSERQAFAYGTAWTWIRENPGGFSIKALRELLDLLLINYGGAERLTKAFSIGETPIPHQLGLLADDVLYLLAAPLAVVGLWGRQRRPGKGLAAVWLGYNLLTGPLFIAINRFRLPLLPILFIYAACALVQLPTPRSLGRRPFIAWGLGGGLFLLLLLSFVWWPPALHALDPKRDPVLDLSMLALRNRWLARDCERATDAVRGGDLVEAQRLVDQGSRQESLPCFALVQARILHGQDADQEAIDLLQDSTGTDTTMSNARMLLLEGDLRRAQGQVEEARRVFNARQVEQTNDLAWAWEHLDPGTTTRIDLGGGLDWGLIDGFYGREYTDLKDWIGTGYRWTGPVARLRFRNAGTGEDQLLRLRVAAGPRPQHESPAILTILHANRVIEEQVLPADWTEWTLELGPTPAGEDVIVTLRSNVFVPSPRDPQSEALVPRRLLGVQVDWAELQPSASFRP